MPEVYRKIDQSSRRKISLILPKRFALILNGWSASYTHYFAVFASFHQKNKTKYETVLSGFSLFEVEIDMSANSHVELIEFVLHVFN